MRERQTTGEERERERDNAIEGEGVVDKFKREKKIDN